MSAGGHDGRRATVREFCNYCRDENERDILRTRELESQVKRKHFQQPELRQTVCVGTSTEISPPPDVKNVTTNQITTESIKKRTRNEFRVIIVF